MPKFNLPDPKDENFNQKIVDLLTELFDDGESDVHNFRPIATPTEGLQIGSVWFDSSDGKLKANTSAGVKTFTFDP